MSEVAPFILNHPIIQVGDSTTTPPGAQIQCSANEVHATVTQDDTVTETFCGSYTSYKAEVWLITLNALASYGDDGLWNLMRPFVGQVVPFILVPDGDQDVSVDNPAMTGTARVKAFSFIDATVGEASAFDFVLAVQGTPDFPITPPSNLLPETTGAMQQAAEPAGAPA